MRARGRYGSCAGKGNNAGDGLVAARVLAEAGHEVEVLFLWPAGELSPDAAANRDRYGGASREVGAGDVAGALAGSGVVVDAVFGTGFSGAPRAPPTPRSRRSATAAPRWSPPTSRRGWTPRPARSRAWPCAPT